MDEKVLDLSWCETSMESWCLNKRGYNIRVALDNVVNKDVIKTVILACNQMIWEELGDHLQRIVIMFPKLKKLDLTFNCLEEPAFYYWLSSYLELNKNVQVILTKNPHSIKKTAEFINTRHQSRVIINKKYQTVDEIQEMYPITKLKI